MASLEHLYWPPAVLLPENSKDNRVDLLQFLDNDVYQAHSSYPLKLPGVEILRDRVVLCGFTSRGRDTQTALASQFQASFAEQGYHVVVKEWASESQKRSILRIRLKCRFAVCRFHCQINYDSNMGYWFLSRRRCGVFQHSCRAQETQPAQNNTAHALTQEYAVCPPTRTKRPNAESPPNVYAATSKRARFDAAQEEQRKLQEPYLVTPRVNASHHALSVRTVSCEHSPAALAEKAKPAPKNENAAMEDFAESLLELSKGKAGKDDGSTKTEETEKDPKEISNDSETSKSVGSETSASKKSVEKTAVPQGQASVAPNGVGAYVPGARTRPVVLGEIPYASQAFQQMAATMGPSLLNHVMQQRGEVTLQMTFDGEGFVLRTNVPVAPPPLPSVPPTQHQQHQPQHQHRGSISSESSASRVSLPNYAYLPQRHYPAAARNDNNVVML